MLSRRHDDPAFRTDEPIKVYRVSAGLRNRMAAAAAAQSVLVASIALYLHVIAHRPIAQMGLISALGLGGSLVLLGSAVVSATSLYPDRIEVRRLFSRRVLRKADIAHRSIVTTAENRRSIQLTPRAPNARPLFLQRNDGDAAFQHWLQDIPVAADQPATVGPFPAGRLAAGDDDAPSVADARAQAVASLISAASLIAFGWYLFVHRPYWLAAACVIALPIVALAAAGLSNGAIALSPKWRGRRPHLVAPLFAGLVLCFAPPGVANDHAQALAPTLAQIAMAAALFAGVVWLDRASRRQWLGLAGVAVLCLLYGKGAAEVLNRIADTAPAQPYRASILHTLPGGTVAVQPWIGSRQQLLYHLKPGDDIRVVRGQAVCMGLHPGALGLRWADVRACG